MPIDDAEDEETPEYGQTGYRLYFNRNSGITLMIWNDGDMEMAVFPDAPELLRKIASDLLSIADDSEKQK